MLASNGNTRETSISTPAMGHDSAWRKAATVAIIAATLPRSSRGLDDIASTTDNVGEIETLLAENRIVTGRPREEGYAVVLGQPASEVYIPCGKRTKTQNLLFCRHPSYSGVPFFQAFSFMAAL